jgi:tryptophan halogenase
MNKKIVVVGGGTAGWLTALVAKYSLPDCEVTVIESDKIGILGAGEGTTPGILGLLSMLEINSIDFLKKTGGTLKSGIKFTNWNKDNEHYYHPFYSKDKATTFEDFLPNIDYDGNIYYEMAIYNGLRKKEFHHDHMVIEENKSFNIALHFDAIKVAAYLRDIAIERGISLVSGEVESFIADDSTINSIILVDGLQIESDFIFDCTGFSKLIIGKHFNAEWVDYSKYLPVDSAMPFFIPQDEIVPIYTESIAMNYGWMWKIPLVERYGCGYVYDSSRISDDDAKKEIVYRLGFEPIWPRGDKGSFKFKSGTYKETWIGNCIAIGLSAGFIEPLEATSIALFVFSLKTIFNDTDFDSIFADSKRDIYNKEIKGINDGVLNYIYYHYITDKTENDFLARLSKELK